MLANRVKICTECGECKSIDRFSKDAQKRDGLRSNCRTCSNAYYKKYMEANKDGIKEKARDYHKKNKDKNNQRSKEYYHSHKMEAIEYDKNRDKILVSKQKAVMYKKNIAYYLKKSKEYYINNRDKYANRTAKRRALKLKATPLWANKGYVLLFFKLAKIESERTGMKVEVDHIIPLTSKEVCGLHCEDNLQLLFSVDNKRKSNKLEYSLGGVSS